MKPQPQSPTNTTRPENRNRNETKEISLMNRRNSRYAVLTIAIAILSALLLAGTAHAQEDADVIDAVQIEVVEIEGVEIDWDDNAAAQAVDAEKPSGEVPPEYMDPDAVEATVLHAAPDYVADAPAETPDTETDSLAPDGSGAVGQPDRNEYDVGYDSIYPAWNVDAWHLYADGGESLMVTMERTSGRLDSYLKLYDPYGRLVSYKA